tara:strand:+ start:456 stop:1109 length:654 start_codon:yes stop_codon:yes gene_type:complete
MNNVYVDVTDDAESGINKLEFDRHMVSLLEEGKPTIVNDRNVSDVVVMSETSRKRFEKGDGKFTSRKRGATKESMSKSREKKIISKVNKFLEQEEHEKMREYIYDPLYDSSLTDSQPYEINSCGDGYSGPGKIIQGYFFPPPCWIYPKDEYEKIMCHIDAIENGYGRKYKLNYYRGDKQMKNPIGIVFFKKEEDIVCRHGPRDNYGEVRVNVEGSKL